MISIEHELGEVLATIRSGHDVLPFMERMISAEAIRLAIVPNEMMQLLIESADFRSLDYGASPTWFQISAHDDRAAELVVYRAKANGHYYMVAPLSS